MVRITTDSGQLPRKVYRLINDRFHLVTQGISRVERATGISYPLYYIEPNLVVSTSAIELGQFGILFARTIPIVVDNDLRIVVQITAPLITCGHLGSIHAILAHEFLHYLRLMSKIIKMDLLSDDISRSLFEQKYVDHSRLIQEKVVFKNDPTLIRHLLSRFSSGFKDTRLEDRVMKEWMHKGLPVTTIPLDSNVTKLPIDKVASVKIDPELKEKIFKFESQELNSVRFRHNV
jgi:hypothetical protein